jgi:hypothetical protein
MTEALEPDLESAVGRGPEIRKFEDLGVLFLPEILLRPIEAPRERRVFHHVQRLRISFQEDSRFRTLRDIP